MKKYMICLFLFVLTSAVCLTAGISARRRYEREHAETVTETAFATESVTEDQLVSSQQRITHKNETAGETYYLVSEDGFLLVFLKDQKTICLYTHIPLTDFPLKEQDRLREGIWFSSMIEVFNYLESYTS